MDVLVAVAPTPQPRQDVVDPQRAPEATEHVPLLTEAVDPLHDLDRPEGHRPDRLQLQADGDVVALNKVTLPGAPVNAERSSPDTHASRTA